jgi:hypothetical protein
MKAFLTPLLSGQVLSSPQDDRHNSRHAQKLHVGLLQSSSFYKQEDDILGIENA